MRPLVIDSFEHREDVRMPSGLIVPRASRREPGGSNAAMADLNRARDAALKERTP